MGQEPYVEEYTIQAGDFTSIGEASTKFRATLKMLGIPSEVVRRAAVVAYEAEMNAMIHGGGGTLRMTVASDHLEIMAADQGPGIPDVALAMQEGYSTASDEIRELGFGAGMGLPNIERNSDRMNIETEVGTGTVLTARIDFPGQ
ncbi:ATP-binding protein [Aminivibrio sp.]|uniref:ATP-binding protein n=1 Tax=Aminivibrio sp. TaxID=1872489 RepID=UPI001A56B966|nr:ATP-binding protein [Aminivibrio sp.]MBL3540506.1 ATP-binding protein [Aminivibrio sp.]MDK2958767.1 serine/threonine-protein kinase RsbT [Synergistaceae bacterium]